MKSEQRMLLAVALSVAIFYVWGKWIMPPPSAPTPESSKSTASVVESVTPATDTDKPSSAAAVAPLSSADSRIPVQEVVLRGQKSELILTNDGAVPTQWLLEDYRADAQKEEHPIDLVTAPHMMPLQVSIEGFENLIPAQRRYAVSRSNDTSATFLWSSEHLAIEKTYTLDPVSYALQINVKVTNRTKAPLQGRIGMDWKAFNKHEEKRGGFFALFLPPTDHWRPVYFADGGITRLASADAITKKGKFEGNVAWAGMENRYFLAALLPQEAAVDTRVVTQREADAKGETLDLQLFSAPTVLPSGGTIEQKFIVYGGPKEVKSLKQFGVGLDESIDYGVFSIVAMPILYLLKFFYSFIKNYGLAIIVLTLLIKLLLHPITKMSLQSMRKMQLLQPELKALREKFKDDRQRINMEMMQLFQRHKVNPMSGCLPMVLQIPVYIALYKVLWNSVELYRAPFFWFYRDLSAPDPYFISPVLLGIAFFLQQKLTPSASMDPAQRKMMMFMPIMFTTFMVFLPSGLVIYILINTLFSVLQQWLMNRGLGFRDLFKGNLTPKSA